MGEFKVLVKNKRGIVVAETVVDEQDAELMNAKWRLNSMGYIYKSERGRPVYLHREILGLPKDPDGIEGDHINRNRLDNRRCNLRSATHAQNMQNQPGHGSSQYRGVFWMAKDKRWCAQVRMNGKAVFRKYFLDEKNAAIEASAARKRLMPYAVESQLFFPAEEVQI